MAKSGFLTFIDDKLEQLFHKKARDPSKDRQKMLDHLNKCDEQFRNPPAKGRKFVTVKNDVVKFAPRYRFHGKDAHYMPKDAYPNASKTLRNEIVSGQHDSLAETSGSSGGRSGGGKSWTPERRAAYQATMAAKKRK